MLVLFFFFKQKTAYDMRISDWSSDVCSSDLFAISARQRRSAHLTRRVRERRKKLVRAPVGRRALSAGSRFSLGRTSMSCLGRAPSMARLSRPPAARPRLTLAEPYAPRLQRSRLGPSPRRALIFVFWKQ